jgi:hypothetical protein
VGVPDGFTPWYLQPAGSGRLWVHFSSATGLAPIKGDPTGFMLLVGGQLATSGEGPCAGPLLAPRNGETGLDALAADWMGSALYALKRTDAGAVIAVHAAGTNYRLLDQLITFEGKNVATITDRGNPNIEGDRKTLFRLDPDARINQDTARRLALFYELRHELDRRRLVLNPLAFTEPNVAFDEEEKRWIVTFTHGRVEMVGISRSVILDAHGRLVTVRENWYSPR